MDRKTAVEILLSKGVDPDFFDDGARHQFLDRCKNGPTRELLAFLTCGMPAHGPEFQSPPIVKAAEGGDLERILLLQSHGASIEERDATGDSALHTAANWRRERLVAQLMQAGARADVVNEKRWTPLTYALQKGHVEIVDVLLAHGADPDFSPVDGGALVFALDKPDLLTRLLDAGADAGARYANGSTLLLFAASRGSTEAVRLLLERGAEDVPNPHGWTARMVAEALGMGEVIAALDESDATHEDVSFYELHRAAQEGDVSRLRVLIEEGHPLDARDWNGYTPLLVAGQNKQHDAVRFLVDSGADTKATTGSVNALTFAARDATLDLVDFLLEAGTPANEAADTSTALVFAATTTPEIVERLLKAGAAVDSTDVHGQTPLYRAAAANQLDIARLLLDAGASTASGDASGERDPLRIATMKGHVDMVRLLVESGADLDAREPILEKTALLQACGVYGNTKPVLGEITRLLLGAGADYTVTGRFGVATPRTEAKAARNQPCLDAVMAFLTAPKREPDSEVLSALIDAGEYARVTSLIEGGVDPAILTQGPQPPLFAALRLDDPTLARLMLERGADPHARFHGRTTLSHAASAGHAELVNWLVEAGVDPNAVSESHNGTAMTAAAGKGHVEVMERLVAAGAEVDLWRAGWSPLMRAAQGGHIDAVQWLLEQGADPSMRNTTGETARDIAQKKKHTAVVERLNEVTPVDTLDAEGRTPLLRACILGDIPLIEDLLGRGADPTITDEGGRSARDVARRRRRVAELLEVEFEPVSSTEPRQTPTPFRELLRGELDADRLEELDLSVRDHRGDTLLHYAVRRGDEALTRALLDAGADAAATNEMGESVWACAFVTSTNDALAELVREHGGKVDVDAQMRVMDHLQRWRAAVQEGDLELIDSLLEERIVPLDLVDAWTTPLLQAVRRRDHEMAELVLSHGADVEATLSVSDDPAADAPLAEAARSGRLELVEMLLERGASLAPTSGCTPLEAAALAGEVAVIDRLLDAGASPTFDPSVVDSRTALGALLTVALERDMPDWVETIRGAYPVEIPDAGLRAALEYNEGCPFEGVITRQAALSSITRLEWSEDGIGEHAPDEFVRIESLAGLDHATELVEVGLTGNALQSLEGLAGCRNLTDVWVESNDLVDISAVRDMRGLSRLMLARNYKLTNITAIARARNLRVLDLSDTAVRDLTPLRALDQLEEVRVWGLDLDEGSPSWNVLVDLAARGVEVRADSDVMARLEAATSLVGQ